MSSSSMSSSVLNPVSWKDMYSVYPCPSLASGRSVEEMLSPTIKNRERKIIYTEHQKKHHFFKATFTNIHHIKKDHIWTLWLAKVLLSYETHLKTQRIAFVKQEKYAVELQKVIF